MSDDTYLGGEVAALLREKRVLGIEKLPDGRFEFFEMCDEFFGAQLTAEQVIALADELRSMAARFDT